MNQQIRSSLYLPVFCSLFLVGIFVLSVWGNEVFLWVAVLIILLSILFFYRHLFFFVVIVVALVSSFWSYSNMENSLTSYTQYKGQFIEGEAYVISQEDRSYGKQRALLKITSGSQLINERIQLSAYKFPKLAKGQTISFSCYLETPEPFEGFAYDRYLASQSIFLLCPDARYKIIIDEYKDSNPVEWSRIQIQNTITSLWPRPISSLAAGLLLGTRESFPESTTTAFRRSGITHIIALSGFNISILIIFLENFFTRIYLQKYWRLWIIVGGICFFTLFVGSGASIVRAAIMGSLVLIGRYYAKTTSAVRIMIICAAAMTLLNPFVLVYDVGFQLSFVSTIGLLYLTTFFERLFFLKPLIIFFIVFPTLFLSWNKKFHGCNLQSSSLKSFKNLAH